jgi:hypothetical protein
MICWPNPDQICLQGGCIYCADGPHSRWVAEHELDTFAAAKGWGKDLEFGWVNPNITKAVLSDKEVLLAFTGIATTQVAEFALGTLEEWMTGATPVTDDIPVQYDVASIEGAPPGEIWLRFKPFEYSADGYTKRPTNVYSIRVTVTEVTRDVI